MKPEITSKILADARKKIARKLAKHGVFDLEGEILNISDTTDIKCPVCKGSGGYFPKDRVKQPTNVDCPKCKGTGRAKHPWKIRVVLENGELPVEPECIFPSVGSYKTAQQDMLNAGYRQVVE